MSTAEPIERAQHLHFRQFSFLQGLSRFADSWQAAAAHAVCEEPEAARLCDDLVVYGLIQRLPDAGLDAGPRYQMDADLRAWLRERLDTVVSGDLDARYQAYYCALAQQAEFALRYTPPPEWLHRLDAEAANLAAVFRMPGTDTLTFATSLWRWWLYRERYREGMWFLKVAVNAHYQQLQQCSPAFRALGVFHHRLGDRPMAERYLQLAFCHAMRAGRRDVYAHVLHELSILAWQQGEYADAYAYCQDSLGEMKRLGDAWGTAAVINEMGIILWHKGDTEQAYPQFRLAFVQYKLLGDSYQASRALNNMALMADETGQYEIAAEKYEQSLCLLRDLNKPRQRLNTLHNLGVSKCHLGEFEESNRLLRSTLVEMREIGYCDYVPLVVANLGHVAYRTQDAKRALTLFGAAQALRRRYPMAWPPSASQEFDDVVNKLRSSLSKSVFTRLWRKGDGLALEDVLAFLAS